MPLFSCSDHDDDDLNFDIAAEGERVFDIPCSVEDESSSDEEEVPGKSHAGHAPVATNPEDVIEEIRCIAFGSCLTLLGDMRMPSKCPRKGCRSDIKTNLSQNGTAVFITWVSAIFFF